MLKRIKTTKIILTLLFITLSVRILQIQYFKGNELEVIADSQYQYVEKINELNFNVLDSKGNDLVEYERRYVLAIDLITFKRNNNSTSVSSIYAFSYILKNYNQDYDLSKMLISSNSSKIYLKLDKDTYDKLKLLKDIKGIYLYVYDEVNRNEAWKIENMITNLKFNKEVKKVDSLEYNIYENTKSNKIPTVTFEKDLDGSMQDGNYSVDDEKINVRLTLDKDMQASVRTILSQDKYKHYNQIGITLVEAHTGKIKVMAQRDEEKPNINLASTTENGYVPGSIFKLLIEEIAIDRGLFSTQSKFNCEFNEYSICKRAHGELTLEEALLISCNNIFAQVGKTIGWDTIEEYAKKQGIFEKVLNISGNGEATGDFALPKIYEDGPRFLAIGQNMRITPLQATNIISTIINDGIYVKPNILEGYVDNYNNIINEIPIEENRVIKKETTKIMKDQMVKVVREEKGTGKNALVKGIETGGKTGTTTRMEPSKSKDENEDVMEKHSDGWFAGYYKHEGKYYSLVVFVKDINEDNQTGGGDAGPIFKEIVENFTK
ncbi:penicillin-binding protein 2 [Clostridium algidicarnis]|uniref:penicillin-binding transpeptidase domain-containing protein n=1 Tax=Clostridium algidicarnis TaxID=37659 RepID=UPI001C0CD6F1|nr:penicillin-binding transpeptidase domain-containing protein [Clostridium algidicarnis]MBU3195701.1 penicillin-binding protein 2 [Clostridium algidicarnis]